MWTCSICGYQHNDTVEDIPFDQLPDDWKCPVCYADKGSFNNTK